MEWLKELKKEDLPEQYHEMVDLIGIENTLKLAEKFPKQPFYFIGLEGVIEKKKKEYIHKNFNGHNHKELARATGYSLRWVYEILKGEKDDRQADLFKHNNPQTHK